MEQQQESDAACENRDIRTLQEGSVHISKSRFGSNQILRILSQNIIFEGSQDPAKMRCHYMGGSKFAGSLDNFKIVL